MSESRKSTMYLMVALGIVVVVAAVLVVTQYQTSNLQASISQLNNVALSSSTSSTKSTKIKMSKKKIFDGKMDATFVKHDLGYSININQAQFAINPSVSEETANAILAKMQEVSLAEDKPQMILKLDRKTGNIVAGNIYALLTARKQGKSLKIVKEIANENYEFEEGLQEYDCAHAWSYIYQFGFGNEANYLAFGCESEMLPYDSGSEAWERLYMVGDITSTDFEFWGGEYIKPFTSDWAYTNKDTLYTGEFGYIAIFAQ